MFFSQNSDSKKKRSSADNSPIDDEVEATFSDEEDDLVSNIISHSPANNALHDDKPRTCKPQMPRTPPEAGLSFLFNFTHIFKLLVLAPSSSISIPMDPRSLSVPFDSGYQKLPLVAAPPISPPPNPPFYAPDSPKAPQRPAFAPLDELIASQAVEELYKHPDFS